MQLVWSREEAYTHDQYRPMGLVKVRAGLDANNRIVGWQHRNVSPSILSQRGVVLGDTGDSQGSEASSKLPDDFGGRRLEWASHPSLIPVEFWRSVGESINTFAVESMADELARAARQDAYAFRRARITDARWLAVLDAAAALGGWSSPPASGRADAGPGAGECCRAADRCQAEEPAVVSDGEGRGGADGLRGGKSPRTQQLPGHLRGGDQNARGTAASR